MERSARVVQVSVQPPRLDKLLSAMWPDYGSTSHYCAVPVDDFCQLNPSFMFCLFNSSLLLGSPQLSTFRVSRVPHQVCRGVGVSR